MDENHFKEWASARETIKNFDDKLHDLRKYGFSFLTALLTAQSILIPSAISAAFGDPGVPEGIKLSVFLVTLLLIVAIRLIERNYQLFIDATVQRALILERILNLELTETISQRHQEEKMPPYEGGLYGCFVGAVLVLGIAVLYPNWPFVAILVVLSSVTLFVILKIGRFKLRYDRGTEDWVLDPTECPPGGTVRITVTNLHRENPLDFTAGVVWEVRTEEGALVHTQVAPTSIRILPEDSYTWPWTPATLGVYRVYPRGWPRALRRKILVANPPPKGK